jgi:hypothetical protein
LFRSSDKGGSWIKVEGGLKSIRVNALTMSGAFVIAGDGVFQSRDNGGSWAECNAGLIDKSILSLAGSPTFLFAGTENTGVWKRSVSELSTAIRPRTPFPDDGVRFLNPGPDWREGKIEFALDRPAGAELISFDSRGARERAWKWDRLEAGPHAVFLGGGSTSGPHLLRLRSGSATASEWIVLGE